MGIKVGHKSHANYKKMYRLSGKRNKFDPRIITAMSITELVGSLKNGRKKDVFKIQKELAKRGHVVEAGTPA